MNLPLNFNIIAGYCNYNDREAFYKKTSRSFIVYKNKLNRNMYSCKLDNSKKRYRITDHPDYWIVER